MSGGQKQRLAIARAVQEPEIYIFDDSFSALDYKTDRVLRSVLKRETAGVTSMIVAQRIGTILDADQIIVLDEGRAVGKGTHRELLKSCGSTGNRNVAAERRGACNMNEEKRVKRFDGHMGARGNGRAH